MWKLQDGPRPTHPVLLRQLQAPSLHPLAPGRHWQQGLAMAAHPTTILGLGESEMEGQLFRDRGRGTWGRVCVLVQSSVQSRRLWYPGGAEWSRRGSCPLSSGPDLSLTTEGSALEAGIWVWGLVQTGRRTGRRSTCLEEEIGGLS